MMLLYPFTGDIIKNFCPLPFNSLSLTSDGSASICCHSRSKPCDENGETFNFNKHKNLKPEDILNSKLHKELRRDFISGARNPACKNCWDIEDAGGHSYRQGWLSQFSEKTESYVANTGPDGQMKVLISNFIELSLGNKCNLRCRMCNPQSSALWVTESLQFNIFDEETTKTLRHVDWYQQPAFKDSIKSLFRHASRVNFLGGEPLIIEEHFEFLQHMVDEGIGGQVELQYNSNLTVLNPRLSELWPRFKKINLCVSLDGFGAMNDYLRFPSKWSTLENNLSQLQEMQKIAKVEVLIAGTFHALNVMYLPELYQYVAEMSRGFARFPAMTWVEFPSFLSASVLPRAHREAAFEKNENALNEITARHGELPWLSTARSYNELMMKDMPEAQRLPLWHRMVDLTVKLDKNRGQDLRQVNPELGQLIYTAYENLP